MTKMKKSNIVIVSLFVLFIVIGISYAFINLTLEGTKKQVITSGNISLELDEDENNLTITNALPMYDEVGMLEDPFTFRLINNENTDTAYTMRLIDITDENITKLDESIVKYDLVKNNLTTIGLLSDLDNGLIDFGVISGKQIIEYELRFWIDSSVEDNSTIKNKSLSYKIEVEVSQPEGSKYKVYFESSEMDIEPIIYTYGEMYNTLPSVVKENYKFAGWYTSDGELIEERSIVKVIPNNTLYAKWSPISYTVVYNSNGGSGTVENSIHQYDIEKELNENKYTRNGYTFDSWNISTDGSGTSFKNREEILNLTTEDNSVINLYAQWVPNTYTVVYDGNGATSGTMTSSTHTYDVAKTLNANNYVRSKHTFVGWNTKADGSGTSYTNGASVKNLTTINNGKVTLYAQWDIATTVTKAVDLQTAVENYKSTITEVEFLDTVPNLSSYSNVWNISESMASETVAYLDGTKLYIASDGGVVAGDSCYRMFKQFTSLKSIKFNNNFDTSNVVNMHAMFNSCTSLTSLDLSSFKTSKATDMSAMFAYSSSLATINLSSFNTSKVVTMQGMFAHCTSLKTLNLSNFDTTNVTNMRSMFYNVLLTTLDLTSFNTLKVSNMYLMFAQTSNLKTIYVTSGKWSTTLASNTTVNIDGTNYIGTHNMFGATSATLVYK